jgi:type I restriction enzyme R subunit
MTYPPRPDSEAALENAALEKFRELGWETLDTYQEFELAGGSTLGRESKSDVLLRNRLSSALSSLNPNLPPEAIGNAIEDLSRDRSRMSLAAANRDVHSLLKEGIETEFLDPATGEHRMERVQVIDWTNPERNDFLICSQFWITGDMYTRRADLVGFVNGIPMLFIELKASHRKLRTAYSDNLRDYKDTVPQVFWYNSFIILSNGSDTLVGSTTASWEHFAEWKKVASEEEEGVISLETVIKGTCSPHRFLDLTENFILFKEAPGGLIKIIAKNHQYLGVTNALSALEEVGQREGRLGVFWHTQGSGKSISMIFFAQKVLRKKPGNWTFVVVTDRKELDDQIYGNFETSGVITECKCQAESSAHLRELLRENHRYVFTLIHKFRTEVGETHPVLSERSDIIVMTDEAHRSQYDTLALNMRTALPNASFLAFTGTPLIVGEEKTRDVFGEYISIYDFKQSVDDGATVPLYYENRIPELQLTNENLNEDMERLLEEVELDDAQEKKLEREFAREYHLITREDRLDAVAEDIVTHFIARGFKGKAMVVCIDKATAVRMYDSVRENWLRRMEMLRSACLTSGDEERSNLEEEISYMEETDMAVVISQSQNEIADMREKGLDIRPHRERMIREDLGTKFKDPDDPFRLVFVCAMWMTGFDAPSCSTIYLDKPMRNHTLMQTIARANRVFGDKVNGLIVDYVGVFRSLEKALAIYGAGDESGDGANPVLDKSKLVAALEASIDDTREFCKEVGFSLDGIIDHTGFELISAMDDAVDLLVSTEETQARYRSLSNDVNRFFKAILPDRSANRYAGICRLIRVISRKIQILDPDVDIEDIEKQVEELLDESISPDSYQIKSPPPELVAPWVLDLSKVDFDALRLRFENGRKHTETERLKRSVERKLCELVALNKTRMDFYEHFKLMIENYNTGSASVLETYNKLLELARKLSDEERRTISEGLTEEELAVFDLLTKPEIEMTEKERDQVKKASRHLLEVLKKERLVLDWRKNQATRSGVRVAIETVFDEELPEVFDKQLFNKKSKIVFQHIYDSYIGAGKSVYGGIA